MNRPRATAAFFIGSLALCLGVGSVRAAEPRYTIIDLGAMVNNNYSYATGINGSGAVVGGKNLVGTVRAWNYHSDGTINTDIGTLGGSVAQPFGINDSGVVVGSSSTGTATRAFRYDGTTMITLGSLGGSLSEARGINNAGQIVGYSYPTGSTDLRAFVYENGAMHGLAALSSGYNTAQDINESGQIVGSFGANSSSLHPYILTGNTLRDLGTFGGINGSAAALNNPGDVVGYADDAIGSTSAYVWFNGAAEKIAIPRLGYSYSVASDINDARQVVGQLGTGGGLAFLYENGATLDLNTLIPTGTGWKLTRAYAINASGQIAGSGVINGQTHAFLLTPVPEPAPAAIIACASLAIGATRRRGNRIRA